MDTPNPYKPIKALAVSPVRWRHRAVRFWITCGILGGVLGIVAGVFSPIEPRMARAWLSYGLFFVCQAVGICGFRVYPDDDIEKKSASHIFAVVTLIWLIVPISSSVNAMNAAAGVYDPIAHDGFRYSMPYWWLGNALQILLGVICTAGYFLRLRTEERLPSGRRYVFISWGIQFPLWYAWSMGWLRW